MISLTKNSQLMGKRGRKQTTINTAWREKYTREARLFGGGAEKEAGGALSHRSSTSFLRGHGRAGS